MYHLASLFNTRSASSRREELMIQVSIDKNDPLGQVILHRAQHVGKTPEQVAAELTRKPFKNTIRTPHQLFRAGEFPRGVLPKKLGIPPLNFFHPRDDLG